MEETPTADYAALIREAEERLGVTVLPFQREWLKAYLAGGQVFFAASRRVGWVTVRQVAEAVRTRPLSAR